MSVDKDQLYGWRLELGTVDFEKVWRWQQGLVKMRRDGMARDTIILVEHPPVFTVGKDAHRENYASLEKPPVAIERGGDVTYHGPGQLVAYFIFNLARRGRNIHRFMEQIQDGVSIALMKYNVISRKDNAHTGVWVGDRKLASIGIAVKHWISFHGVAINLNIDSKQFSNINPCGLEAGVMVSLRELIGKEVDMREFGEHLCDAYGQLFDTQFDVVQLDDLAEIIQSQKAGGHV
jgi:lipoate-protein ligase B